MEFWPSRTVAVALIDNTVLASASAKPCRTRSRLASTSLRPGHDQESGLSSLLIFHVLASASASRYHQFRILHFRMQAVKVSALSRMISNDVDPGWRLSIDGKSIKSPSI